MCARPENDSDLAAHRRQFLAQLTGMAAAAALGQSAVGAEPSKEPAPPLPSIQLGKYRISRLVAGSNPISGYSYQGQHVDRLMKEYFTVERAADFLLDCQRAGITANQFSRSPTNAEGIQLAREKGCTLSFLALHDKREELPELVKTMKPIAIAHHGGSTDKLFSKGRSQQVHDYVKAVHDQGILAGVSAHNPDNIKRIADEGWEVDYFMTCFYFVTRHSLGDKVPELPTLELGHYPFYRDDPKAMTAVVRQVKQPCLGFKILGGGRLCASQATVREAFRFAFSNIKPTDGVILGMFPRFFDEVTANATYTRELGSGA